MKWSPIISNLHETKKFHFIVVIAVVLTLMTRIAE